MNDLSALLQTYLETNVVVQLDTDWFPAQEVVRGMGTDLHVITAWNPGSERPSAAVNRSANDALRSQIELAGLTPIPAIGRDPHSDHAEESWAVSGFTDSQARELGAVYDQVAVFRITARQQIVLACDGGIADVSRTFDE